MAAAFEGYLDHLEKLEGILEELTGLAKRKSRAANLGELDEMEQVMRREQALSMSIRGMEQKRGQLTRELGLEGVTLSALPDRAPPELRPRTKNLAEKLLRLYTSYQDASSVARTTLECNLHMIEKNMGTPPPTGSGGSMADIRA